MAGVPKKSFEEIVASLVKKDPRLERTLIVPTFAPHKEVPVMAAPAPVPAAAGLRRRLPERAATHQTHPRQSGERPAPHRPRRVRCA